MKYSYKTVTLRDGRILAYSEFGDPKGRPVINCHGGLVNRLDISWAHQAAKKHGIRIISPDRPGVGYSSMQKNRALADWAEDIADLSDQLSLKKFGVIGWSMGGQYALACAHALPRHVSKLVIVASCLELTVRRNAEQLNPMDRKLSRLAHSMPWLSWYIYASMWLLVRFAPKTWRRVSAKELSESDARVVRDPSFDFITPTKQALRKPSGMIEEYRAFNKPWGFKPKEVTVPTFIWQGTSDTLVPHAWATVLADTIPGSKLRMIKNAGHFVAHQEIDAIMAVFSR